MLQRFSCIFFLFKPPWPRGTCLVTGDSMSSYIDEARMSRKFNVKVRTFLGTKTDDMFHYLVPLLEKNPNYVILHALVPTMPSTTNQTTLFQICLN